MKHLDKVLQRWRIRKAAEYIPLGASLLDVGTADGTLFRAIAGLGDSVGVDVKLDYENLPKSSRVKFYQGMFPQALPGTPTFDVITMLATLEHIPASGLDALASACAAHLGPGGLLIVTVPSPVVDKILILLQKLHLIHGMATEQHHGFDVRRTPAIFTAPAFKLRIHRRFQLGLNNLFIFERENM